MIQRTVDAAAIEAEVEQLRSMPIVELRALWRAKFKSEPPQAFGPDLLRRSIAFKIQEDVFGGLDRTTARMLFNVDNDPLADLLIISRCARREPARKLTTMRPADSKSEDLQPRASVSSAKSETAPSYPPPLAGCRR